MSRLRRILTISHQLLTFRRKLRMENSAENNMEYRATGNSGAFVCENQFTFKTTESS